MWLKIAKVSTLVFLVGSIAAQERALPIVDLTPTDSPLRNSGTVIFSEAPLTGGGFAISHRDEWTMINVSEKPIVAVVETLQITDGARVSIERLARFDAFFHPKLLEPGKALDPFSQDFFGTHYAAAGYLPLESPRAEVVVRWVQFADGSSYGDNKYSQPLVENRNATLEALRRLKEIAETKGLQAFAQELQKQVVPPAVDGYLDHIRKLQQKRGTSHALETLEAHLAIGQERAALNLIKSGGGTK